ncbi:hypothetical protein [Streptomyces sp. NBC_01207]|uniref:hypothetical protein n=1 Tax=Streptomyces sp. NBC_01207 TaxID=2903772 RepID=UPI002E14273B|nr:hypothetical protein OG457_27140 [Streptomyces sp. NBC_01207]
MIVDLVVWAVDMVQALADAAWWWAPPAVVAGIVIGVQGARPSGGRRTGGDGGC